MDPRVAGAVIGLGIGVVVGGSMGVAAQGGAVNGAYVFGPIFSIIGFLLGRRKLDSGSNQNNYASYSTPTEHHESELPAENLTTLANEAEGIFSLFVGLMCSIWNMEMRGFERIGLMPYLISMPWIFVIIGVLLLALVMPLGVLFCLSAFAAVSKGIEIKHHFKVLKRE